MLRLVAFSLLLSSVVAAPGLLQRRGPDPSLQTTVKIGNATFINKGMVALGVLPANAKDEFGETLGGLGSAIYIKRGKYDVEKKEGVFVLQPDRGFNVIEPVDWQPRFHTVGFTINPYYGTGALSFSAAKDTLKLEYTKTRLFVDRNGSALSGADGLSYRAATATDPVLAIHSTAENKICMDPEGVVHNPDGSYWVSDEYACSVHLFDSTGLRILSLPIPDAVLPRVGGKLNFTSAKDPESGRAANQGFEGLTASADGKMLYAMLQSALMQDGGSSETKETNRYTRLFAWDVSGVFTAGAGQYAASSARLIGEYVVPLPQSSKGKTRAQSEIHYLNGQQFLVLARDGDGHGSDELNTGYKNIDVFDISTATNIVGRYDGPTGAIAPGGILISGITPATYTAFVNLADPVHLKRFGLHNGSPADQTLINSKWESIALTPAGDKDFLDDYFLIAVSDNDFMTTNGTSMGKPYSWTENVDTQIFVYRVTLPTVKRGTVEAAIALVE